MTSTWPQISGDFKTLRRQYELVSKRALELLRPFCDENKYLLAHRLKELDSFLEKLETGRFNVDEIDDIFAVTIIVPTERDVSKCVGAMPSGISIDVTKNTRSRKPEPETFRFDDTICICRLAPRRHDLRSAGDIFDLKFEIQVRTITQHAWSVATHSLAYKAEKVDWRRYRLASQLRAIVEQLDLSYSKFDSLIPGLEKIASKRMVDKSRISEAIDDFFDRGLLHRAVSVDSRARVAETVAAVSSAANVSASKLVRQLDRYLVSAGCPKSLSLTQLWLGVFITENWTAKVESKLANRKKKILVTGELETVFPKVGKVPVSLRVN